jgi:hypothetical protein
MEKAWIRLGGSVGIGSIEVDLARTHGEGGPENPCLVLCLNVTMDPRPAEEMLTLLSLSCALYLTPPGPDGSAQTKLVGAPVIIDLANGKEQFLVRSISKLPAQMQARIPLSEAQVAQLERHRHAQSGTFSAIARLSAAVAWITETGNSQHIVGREMASLKNPFPMSFGMVSTLAHFWTVSVEDLDVRIPASLWVEKVLPGLGLNRLRLIEVMLPQVAGPLPEQIVGYFDTAKRSFDLGHYRQSMVECRDVRNAIEQALGASRTNPVGNVVESRLHLPPGSQQRELLNAAWEALYFDTNVAPHLPGGPFITYADARACLHMTAVVIEYLGQLLS